MGDQWKEVLDLIDQKKAKRTSDTLKANRTYQEELIKSSPEYKETQKKKRKAEKINVDIKLKKAEKEKAGETGEEAEIRLLKSLKEARAQTGGGKRLYDSDFPDKDLLDVDRQKMFPKGSDAEIFYKQSLDYQDDTKGYKDTPTRMAYDRMDRMRGDLKISKSAIDKGIPFNEAKKNKVVMDKYREFYKRFTIPGIDPRKRDHLAKISTQEWYNKAYAK